LSRKACAVLRSWRVGVGIKRRCYMKPLTGNHQLGLVSPLNYTAIQNAKQKVLYEEHGAWMQLTALGSHGEQWRGFFLDILSHRMSEIGILRQPLAVSIRLLGFRHTIGAAR